MRKYSSESTKRWLKKNNLFRILKAARFIAEIRRNSAVFYFLSAVKLAVYQRINKNSGEVISFQPRGWTSKVKVRNCESDFKMLWYVLMEKYHLPKPEMVLPKSPVILDLGCNIGVGSAQFIQLLPSAKVIGYELDAENFDLAVENTKSHLNIKLINAGIWIQNENVSYIKSGRQDSYNIDQQGNKLPKTVGGIVTVNGVTMNNILKTNNLKIVDYLKMDIEGVEKLLFSGKEDLSWMKKVRFVNIEFHLEEGEKLEDYVEIISQCGFSAKIDKHHFSCITAENIEL